MPSAGPSPSGFCGMLHAVGTPQQQLGNGWHSSLLLLEPCSSLGCQLPPAAAAQGDINQKVPTELLADRQKGHSCCHPVTLSTCHPCAADTPLSAAAACAVGSKSLTKCLFQVWNKELTDLTVPSSQLLAIEAAVSFMFRSALHFLSTFVPVPRHIKKKHLCTLFPFGSWIAVTRKAEPHHAHAHPGFVLFCFQIEAETLMYVSWPVLNLCHLRQPCLLPAHFTEIYLKSTHKLLIVHV